MNLRNHTFYTDFILFYFILFRFVLFCFRYFILGEVWQLPLVTRLSSYASMRTATYHQIKVGRILTYIVLLHEVFNLYPREKIQVFFYDDKWQTSPNCFINPNLHHMICRVQLSCFTMTPWCVSINKNRPYSGKIGFLWHILLCTWTYNLPLYYR